MSHGAGDGAGAVVVDADAMQQLTERYARYRRLVERDVFDPVQAMRLGGEVLLSAREIIRTGQPVAANGPGL